MHLGMSGQMLLGAIPNTAHLRIAAVLDDGTRLSFVDQRTFGGWLLADLVTVDGSAVPVPWRTWPAIRSTRNSTPTRWLM
ncbi:formamidopyrimidine-DNA glycosylase N-terminal domain protein [Mycobacterium xenopi 3993]|nr:formamidopyrimidine-DNA glycosylase N-terminal domain protein [Mycobacterium xenopi 3993]